jgi:hypothetical protein
MKILLGVFLFVTSLVVVAEEESDTTLSKEEVFNLEYQHEYPDTKKQLKDLENYESYRPDSYSDAGRNPFQKKRYEFDLDDDN